MLEDERCQRCDYVRLELVDAQLLDAAEVGLARSRARIEAVLPLVRSLAELNPGRGRWEAAFRSARDTARELRRQLGPPAGAPVLQDVAPEVVWRCRVCGAVDAPQECLGICLWRQFDWVEAAELEAKLADARRLEQRAGELYALIRLLAGTEPRPRTWKRNWLALQARAGKALRP